MTALKRNYGPVLDISLRCRVNQIEFRGLRSSAKCAQLQSAISVPAPDLSRGARVLPCLEVVSATGAGGERRASGREQRCSVFPFSPTPSRNAASDDGDDCDCRCRLLKHSRSVRPIDRPPCRNGDGEEKRCAVSLPLSVSRFAAAEPRAALRVHIRAEAGRGGGRRRRRRRRPLTTNCWREEQRGEQRASGVEAPLSCRPS